MAKMTNPWIVHVKAYAKKNNLKYIDALKSGDCKKQYGKKNIRTKKIYF